MDPRRPSRPTSIGYAIVTFFSGYLVVSCTPSAMPRWGRYEAMAASPWTAPPHPTSSPPYHPYIKPTDQCCAVIQTINDATPLQLLLWTASDLIVIALAFVALWQLRGSSGRPPRRPLPATNVRRLRWFGWLLMLGYPAVALASPCSKRASGRPCPRPSPLLGNSAPTVNLAAALLAGLAVLVLAEVFAHGCACARTSGHDLTCPPSKRPPHRRPPGPAAGTARHDPHRTRRQGRRHVVNLSVLKTAAPAPSASPPGRLCQVLDCQPGDLLSHQT